MIPIPKVEIIKHRDNSFWLGNQEVVVCLLPSIAGYIERAIGNYQEGGRELQRLKAEVK